MPIELQPKEKIIYSAPFIPFPSNPKAIELSDLTIWEYVPGEDMNRHVESLIKSLSLNEFDFLAINNNGGSWLGRKILDSSYFNHIPWFYIEYHRPKDGFSANATAPIPNELSNARILVAEDVIDSGGVAQAIRKDAPNSTIAAVVRKRVLGQINVPGVYTAIEVENRWLGGVGMEMLNTPEGELLRRHDSLYSKEGL